MTEQRCGDCEWVNITTWGDPLTQYALSYPCPMHAAYDVARQAYIKTGNEDALADMLKHVKEIGEPT